MASIEQIRIGYACINTQIGRSVNRTCRAKTLHERGIKYAIELAHSNLQTLYSILEWNEENGIRLYRMSSDMFPHLGNPEFIKDSDNPADYAYSLNQFSTILKKIGKYANKKGHRLTFHPGQFNQIGTPKNNVFIKTTRDLSIHADIIDLMSLPKDSVMVVHGGGTYGDKRKTLERWVKQFFQLPEKVQNKIVIENCEKQYNIKDMLKLSKQIDRPVIFDLFHHQCYQQIMDLPSALYYRDAVIKTWTKKHLRPKFHVSEQAPGKRLGAHSDYVEELDQEFFFNASVPIDVMVEAKCKERSVQRLYSKYFSEFNDEHKTWIY